MATRQGPVPSVAYVLPGLENLSGPGYQPCTVRLFAIEKPRPALVRMLRHLRYSEESYQNRYAHSAWVVLRRKAG